MMKNLLAIATLSLCSLAIAAPSQAQHSRGSSGSSGSTTAGRAYARAAPGRPGHCRAYASDRRASPADTLAVLLPALLRGVRVLRWLRLPGYPYYSPYYYPYGYYGTPYAYEGYPPYGGNYAVAPGAVRAQAYGGVRITDAPKDAPVYADGYYVGTVNDFDGAFQHLNLEPGTHHIEVREQGQQPLAIDVNVRPGETITYHAK